jgi:hypothetical protein
LTSWYLDMQRKKAFIRVARRTGAGLAFRKALVTW